MKVRTNSASYFLFSDAASDQGGAPPSAASTDSSVSSGGSAATSLTGSPNGGASAQPSSESPSSPDPFASFDGLDFDSDLDSIEVPVDVTATDAGAQPEAKEPSASAPPKSPDAAAVPAKDSAAAQPPVVPAAPVANEGASSARSPLEEAIEGFKANKADLASWSAGELFKLSPEEQEALDLDASAAIPKLMGRVYVEAMLATQNLMRNFVPSMIQQGVEKFTTTTTKAKEAVNEFYASHKDLDPSKHQPVVDKWVKVFRAANPSASRKEAIAFVGNAVKAELGITSASAAPQAVRAAPFAPARQGGRATPVASQQVDPFAGLDMDFDPDGAEL